MTMTAEWIYAGLLLILSFIFDLLPGAKEWWEAQSEHVKRWGWLIGSLGVPIVLWALCCYVSVELFGFTYACDQGGLIRMVVLGFGAYTFSQGGHAVAKLTGKAY